MLRKIACASSPCCGEVVLRRHVAAEQAQHQPGEHEAGVGPVGVGRDDAGPAVELVDAQSRPGLVGEHGVEQRLEIELVVGPSAATLTSPLCSGPSTTGSQE